MKTNLQSQIDEFKIRIQQENIHNPNKRRIFSTRLKQDVAQFVKQNKLHPRRAAHLLDVGPTTIQKWMGRYKKSHGDFKKIAPASNEKKISIVLAQDPVIKTNQIVLITLTSLLLVERLFLYLTS